MADKPSKNSGSGIKPVPMKLFATWEVEKSSPSCIPRLCSLTLNRLVVNKALENDLASVIIAVKMQNSKRVLRSNEIIVPPGGSLDTELDLSFSLQYPHFFKRDVNKLQIMLQRRKKYKNRTILGFKTLALGQVNMSQVLQRSVDRELKLYSDIKERTNAVAHVSVLLLTSQPVDHEDNGHRKQNSSDVDRSPDVDNDSDEDEVHDFNDQESSSNDDLSDGEIEERSRRRPRKVSRSKIRPVTSRQRNLKQRFIALWKRFKVSEDALDLEADHDGSCLLFQALDSEADHDLIDHALDSEADHDLIDPDNPAGDIDDLLFDELDDLSDSGPELDTMSVMSTPKPRLRPFFSGRSSSSHEKEVSKSTESSRPSDECIIKRTDSDMNASTMASVMLDVLEHDADCSDSVPSESSPRPRSPLLKTQNFIRERSTSYRESKLKTGYNFADRRHSAGGVDDLRRSNGQDMVEQGIDYNLPRKVLLDQLSNVLDTGDDKVPESLILVNTSEWQGQLLVQKLQEKQMRLICTCSNADVKAAITFLVAKIQKYCNSNSKQPGPIKLGVAGNDGYINSVLRPYVEQFSTKSPDWQAYTKFLVIPLGSSSIGRHIANIDQTYSSLFMDMAWKDTFERTDSAKLDSSEIVNRVNKYVSSQTVIHPLPIAEAMVMCKGKNSDEAKQIFIPFVSEVKIGTPDTFSMSVDMEEGANSPPNLSSSPPSTTQLIEKQKEGHTPPSSPNIGAMSPPASQVPSLSSTQTDYVELQVDYWTVANRSEGFDKDRGSKKETNKCSLKTAFRSLNVSRLPSTGDITSQTFSMIVVTKEKKQKIVMRIGKKGKDIESKSQIIDGINRLICTSKSQNFTLKVVIDSVEWTGVKFFQLSSQWQTHIKSMPIAIFGFYDTAL
ncbi:hypothetical protein LOTGIDRAFT_169225 [Lottia gigantea]|uniref:Phosphofurin acidic cluster sorting protein 2 n=1 Tax=Lottia gigantea TaxID=225164 RepID=V3ZH83_LOTGI|nr:hypothetical protein LOTGIDRAFT_169225 [Lottia gigantea]ESO83532.1 hypothetical protein LOTGIDRAFT_169225 [Lottia gigantea]